MELWIRSQNRMDLFKVKELFIYKDDNEDYNLADLGVYKTKERALEVLDEIHYKLANTNYNSMVDDYEIKTNEIVYEMPKE